ncbi:MAG: hypothetical protein PHS60_00435, partial [Zavarzinia sp.]|nr:hypothetical protein [Zavarzinia sp.]
YVLASERMDRHLTYVAMTRHRDDAMLYAGRDEFKGVRDLRERLSRSGAKETTLDYAERRGIAAAFGVAGRIEIEPVGERAGARVAPPSAGRERAATKDAARQEREAARQAPAAAPEDPLLALARSIIAQDRERSSGAGAAQESRAHRGAERAGPPGGEDGARRDTAPSEAFVSAAVAAAKEAYLNARAVAEARAAYEAERARQAELAAERLRLAEEARQREAAEARQRAEQERDAERARTQRPTRSYGMEM